MKLLLAVLGSSGRRRIRLRQSGQGGVAVVPVFHSGGGGVGGGSWRRRLDAAPDRCAELPDAVQRPAGARNVRSRQQRVRPAVPGMVQHSDPNAVLTYTPVGTEIRASVVLTVGAPKWDAGRRARRLMNVPWCSAPARECCRGQYCLVSRADREASRSSSPCKRSRS